jgi:hypothetical protein
MKRHQLYLYSLLTVAALLWRPQASLAANESPVDIVTDYLDYVASGNYESAIQLWSPTCLERALRFGIEYDNIPVRPDASSPMVINANRLASFGIQPARSVEAVGNDGRFLRLQFTTTSKGEFLQQWYYVEKKDGYYWLCYPQDCWARAWEVQESRYFRIHIHPDVLQYVSQPSKAQFDDFVEAVADTLGLTKADLAELATKKIEFFYCNSDSTVQMLTGQLTKGLLDQSSNDIISANFPHHHEVVHLLTNIKLKHLPLYTLPMVREGLAVRFGGRWGKGAGTLLDLGAFLYRDTLVTLDSMLTVHGFEGGDEMDLMYPVAGVMSAYLQDRLGKQKFWPFYLSVSGRQDSIGKWKGDRVKAAMVAATGRKDWADLVQDFNVYIATKIVPATMTISGVTSKGKTLFADQHDTLTLDGDWLNFTVVADSGVLPHASFLFFKKDSFGGQKSRLFYEHFRDEVPFEGYRYGVRVDQNEAGVYDYAANLLTGKFILGINGTEHYYDPDHNKVTVRFKRNLLGKQAPAQADIKVVPF